MSIQTNLVPSDNQRTIRFIETRPVTVSLENDESITHDVERYCGFRQDAFHESESMNDPSVAFLQQAQDAKLKLLESLDRFMSCRQSAPARERLTAVGDMSSGVHLSSDISHSQENIHVDAVKYARAQSLLSWMRDHKISVEMRVINGRIVPMVDLLPSSNRNVMRSVCSISLDGNEPKLQLNSLMRTFIENALSLSVVVDGPISIAREHALSNLSVEDEVLHAQRCALDFAVIRKLQDEAAAPCQNGFRWLKTGVSKHTSNFSASFVIVSEETLCPVNITVGFGPSAGNQSVSICQRLRQRVLEECTSSNIDTVPLSDVLLRGVISLLLGRS